MRYQLKPEHFGARLVVVKTELNMMPVITTELPFFLGLLTELAQQCADSLVTDGGTRWDCDRQISINTQASMQSGCQIAGVRRLQDQVESTLLLAINH